MVFGGMCGIGAGNSLLGFAEFNIMLVVRLMVRIVYRNVFMNYPCAVIMGPMISEFYFIRKFMIYAGCGIELSAVVTDVFALDVGCAMGIVATGACGVERINGAAAA